MRALGVYLVVGHCVPTCNNVPLKSVSLHCARLFLGVDAEWAPLSVPSGVPFGLTVRSRAEDDAAWISRHYINAESKSRGCSIGQGDRAQMPPASAPMIHSIACIQ
jgi:hypothetical protein